MSATPHEILGRIETVSRWIEHLNEEVTGELALRRDLILQARAQGVAVNDIALAAGLHRVTVSRIIQSNT